MTHDLSTKKNMKKSFFLLLSLLLSLTTGAQSGFTVSENPSEGCFKLVGDDLHAVFLIDSEDAEVVATAAGCVAEDFRSVTGTALGIETTDVTKNFHDPLIYVGTVGTPLINGLAEGGEIDLTDIEGKWEVYSIQRISDGKLAIIGSTPRGTAYGLFELSRLIGVTPWIWWADVAPGKHPTLFLSGDRMVSKEPSVKYRGIFINDEDWGLQPWAAKGLDKKYGNIGPGAYARVMELLLRLRANTLWPAMHLCSEAFWANKDNLPVAKKYDIMLGSSHCEQMLRDNEWEWRHAPWNGNNDDWNYVTNKTKIQQYWEERVAESVGYDAMYTLGMRGVHDWGISGYPSTQDKVRGLTEIIGFQRSLLDKYMGDATTVPQLFIPYKEVLDAYNAGLQVPEDVTICWVDDNHGYIRQMPRANEQARSGGNGIYYHLSYLGSPVSYLWLSTISPSLISYELSKAYNQGIQSLWVINVGDIKPAEMELEFCMDLAWDVNRWAPEKAYDYTHYWMEKTFGADLADELTAIKHEYYRLGASGKPEHVHAIAYTREEQNERIADYRAIADRVAALKGSIPAELSDAFFELIEYPVRCAYEMNVKTFRAAQSMELARAGQRDAALEFAAEARQAYRIISDLTNHYNTGIAGGKWNGVMSMKPHGDSQFNMPATATLTSINNVQTELKTKENVVIPAADFTASSGDLTILNGLGISDRAVTVWPLNMTAYTTSRISQAPWAEYDVPVKAGKNSIQVRCLCTFPLNSNYDLRVGVSVDGKQAEVKSLKTTAMEGKWNTTVPQGFNDGTVDYTSDTDKTVKVRVSLMDPGVVLSEIYNVVPDVVDLTLTEELIENYDFEYNHDGQLNQPGNIGRGIPAGWLSKGQLKKGANGLDSYGVNQDALNYHGNNVCWINSVPMPSDFWLYQTIPASKIEPGVYKISCMLWVENSKKTNCRLFANQNVQYYGYESDYTNLLTAGETATYAGYAGGDANAITLRDMEVYVIVSEGEDLTFGIKSSNRKNDGSTATDNSGWFKVDYFRIERVSELPPASEGEDLTLTERVLKNYDFEYYESGGNVIENTDGTTRRYTPYGWNIVGTFPGQSYGINKDANNPHKTNVCWCLPQGGYFPEGFQLYQTVPASELTPGRYLVQCKLWVEENYLATTRLFANQNVQYYGMDIDYEQNLTEGEQNTFAGYIGGANGSYNLQDMWVYVDLAEGEDLTLGIRADPRKSDGTRHSEYKNGWFKVDYFRINKVSETGVSSEKINVSSEKTAPMYDLQGRRINSADKKGIYIQNGKKVVM